MKLLSVFALLAAVLALGAQAMPILEESKISTAFDFSPLQAADYAYPHHVYGSDVSQPHSVDNFRCLTQQNLTFTVVRIWRSLGNADPNAPQTMKNAWNGGQRYVDGYIFPCFSCGSPERQMQGSVAHMRNNGVRFGMLWLDVEGTQYWGGQAANRAFFNAMVAEGQKLGVKLGVYTSKSQWDPIMGDFRGGAHLPLWFAHYDGIPTWEDFVPFGGWSRPAIKQFSDAGKKCGSSYDINWYPA